MGPFDDARRHGRSAGGRGGRGGPVRPIFGEHDHGRGDKPDYKTAALCKQVRRIVGMVLTGECGDPLLQSLIVDEVFPAPHATRLLVCVLLPTPVEDGPTVIDVLQRLAHVEGLLRARVGEGIVRKRTPELTFEVIPITTSHAPAPPQDGAGDDREVENA